MTQLPTLTAWSAAAHELLNAPAGKVALLIDSGIPESTPILTAVRQAIAAVGREATVHRLDPGAGIEAIETVHEVSAAAAALIAVGGGSLIDAAKLARIWAETGVRERLTGRSRSGFITLRPTVTRPASPLIAVPTTLGTGSESSAVAIIDVPAFNGPGRRRLVGGSLLRANASVLLGSAAATLPEQLQREGIAEVLLRLMGSYIGDSGHDTLRDALIPALCQELATVLTSELDDAGRSLVLRAGALSHSAELAPSNPYGAKAWYVATELSTQLGIRKMSALPAVSLASWRRIESGDERWGSASKLRALWHKISADADAVPSEGFAETLRSVGIATTVAITTAATADPQRTNLTSLAQQTLRHWGEGLPMLGGFEPADLERVLHDVATPQKTSTRRSENFGRSGDRSIGESADALVGRRR